MADSTNVLISNPPPSGGTFFRAKSGSTLPTDATTALIATTFEDLGYIGEGGYQWDITRDSTDLKAYGGDTVATTQNSYDETLKVTLIEGLNVEVLKTVFGDDNVDDTDPDAIVVKHNKSRLPRSVFVADNIGEGDIVEREVIPNGQAVSVGTITRVHTDMVKYDLTIKCYPDSAGNTVYHYDSRSATP